MLYERAIQTQNPHFAHARSSTSGSLCGTLKFNSLLIHASRRLGSRPAGGHSVVKAPLTLFRVVAYDIVSIILLPGTGTSRSTGMRFVLLLLHVVQSYGMHTS